VAALRAQHPRHRTTRINGTNTRNARRTKRPLFIITFYFITVSYPTVMYRALVIRAVKKHTKSTAIKRRALLLYIKGTRWLPVRLPRTRRTFRGNRPRDLRDVFSFLYFFAIDDDFRGLRPKSYSKPTIANSSAAFNALVFTGETRKYNF